MAKHSHWHNIRHQKAKEDKKKAKKYAKHSQAITKAAKEGGGDPSKNMALKHAIDNAKNDDVPKDNIERAIKKGTGELLDEGEIERVIYEGYGPEGVPFLIEVATDNRNRASSDIKYIFSKFGGSLGSSGSVKWQFEQKGVAEFHKGKVKQYWENFQLELMEVGAEEIRDENGTVKVITNKEDLQQIVKFLEGRDLELDKQGLGWVATQTKSVDSGVEEKINEMIKKLEELDDVESVYTNLD